MQVKHRLLKAGAALTEPTARSNPHAKRVGFSRDARNLCIVAYATMQRTRTRATCARNARAACAGEL